ncbi:hypothetical protein HDU67_009389 [Dinochytrium kinnereticum]|nr:hypothetical protein HDU67_009389 [Dinochytrium kinnereticum]
MHDVRVAQDGSGWPQLAASVAQLQTLTPAPGVPLAYKTSGTPCDCLASTSLLPSTPAQDAPQPPLDGIPATCSHLADHRLPSRTPHTPSPTPINQSKTPTAKMFKLAVLLLAVPAMLVGASKTSEEAAKNAADGKCAIACSQVVSGDVYKKMIESDAVGKVDNSTCRPVAKSVLPNYNMAGPFVSEAAAGQNVVMTPYGPLDDADRFLVQNVRRAGLWEEPASREAETMATCAKTKEIAALIKEDHIFLDNATLEIAKELNIQLPDDLPSNVQRWMVEMSCASGPTWDAVYAQRLRQAHGNIFTAIAQVRTRTRNNLIRQYATIANTVVMSHMQRLEATDYVDYSILPPSIIGKFDPATGNLQVSAATNK